MTAKQQRFVEEYLVDLNAAAAARRAGYAPKRADQLGFENLRKPEIKAAIDAAQAERSKRTQVNADQVLREAALVAFSDIGEILNFAGKHPTLRPANQITEAGRKAISSIKVKRYTEGGGEDAPEVEVVEFKLWPKSTALEQLMRHLGLFKDREPLEVLLAALPADVGTAVRRELGKLLAEGAAPPGGAAAGAADGPG
jgi:phage terminase small subunit